LLASRRLDLEQLGECAAQVTASSRETTTARLSVSTVAAGSGTSGMPDVQRQQPSSWSGRTRSGSLHQQIRGARAGTHRLQKGFLFGRHLVKGLAERYLVCDRPECKVHCLARQVRSDGHHS
jgi:hypothetical protein